MPIFRSKSQGTESLSTALQMPNTIVKPNFDVTNRFISQYTSQALHIQPDIADINHEQLDSHNNEAYALVDIGADKVIVTQGRINQGEVTQVNQAQVRMYKAGPILPFVIQSIKNLQSEAPIKGICISSHGQIADNHYIDHIAPQLDKELSMIGYTRNLCGYLEQNIPNLLPTTMFNDAVCGGAFSYSILKKNNTQKKHLLYIIIGGGVGGCYISAAGEISASEPSHLPWIAYEDDVDPGPCLEAGPHFCAEVYTRGYYLERQLASKYIGQETEGRILNQMFQKGDKKAEKVYMHGARNLTNIVLGLLFGFWLLQEQKLQDTIIITHGGVADNVPMYNTLIQSYLMNYLHTRFKDLADIPVIATSELLKGYGESANALGAAILGLSK